MAEPQQDVEGAPLGFYVFLGTIGVVFLGIIGYMISVYLS